MSDPQAALTAMTPEEATDFTQIMLKRMHRRRDTAAEAGDVVQVQRHSDQIWHAKKALEAIAAGDYARANRRLRGFSLVYIPIRQLADIIDWEV